VVKNKDSAGNCSFVKGKDEKSENNSFYSLKLENVLKVVSMLENKL